MLITLCLLNLIMGKMVTPPQSDIDLKGKNEKLRQVMLVVGITLNLSVLFYYKYLFWVISELSSIPIFSTLHVREHALPLGISFFTFHAISYLVDVYKGKVGQHSATDFATYFFMFPHLVAGPIVRFESVRNDIRIRKRNYDLFAYGIFRFVLGLNKKILIANFVSPVADLAFASSQSYVPCLTSAECQSHVNLSINCSLSLSEFAHSVCPVSGTEKAIMVKS
ncbi:MAG: hypothetical protein MR571_05000 [Succinatimonas sp.]|nr:hypothetical protein [Succinatimonas sp.]